MRVPAILFLVGILSLGVIAQPAKPKPTPAKSKTAAAKTQTTKPKTAQAKPKSTPAKSTTASKKPAAAKPQQTPPKAKTTTAKKDTKPGPRSTAAKPKPKPETPKVEEPEVDEIAADAEYQKAVEIADAGERIAALKQFARSFAKSKRIPDAEAMIVTVQSQLGNDRLATGDIAGAVEQYKIAIADAPKPMPDQLFLDTLAKFPPNVFFRGARAEAVELARLIEDKTKTSVNQLIGVATFYMSVENGSEARRIAEKAIKLDAASSSAYQTLGLASRMDFLLDESAAAYAKALELDPASLSARRGLAEMKRALGKSDEAAVLYQEILAKEPENLPASTGLILAMFESGKRIEAEAELTKSLEANPGNLILQAGAAYWYAANGEGDKAVDLAQKAIASDPRFIWSHIALARGYIAQKNPTAAEKTLLAARRYGNFPTLDYEIASARAAAGFYREAAEELAKSFTVKDGLVQTQLGGRVQRGSKDLGELVGFERRASIFAPVSPDPAEKAAELAALLEFKQEMEKATPDPVLVAKAADKFVSGDDRMKIHRLIFAGSQLLDKKIALEKVVELTKAAPQTLEAGLDAPDPAAAVMASELYESRTLAAIRGEYINVPSVPKPTLSSVLRGRVEELNGWAHFQLDDPAQASIHLKRAVGVLPVDSAWWRSSTWRLGTSLSIEGKLPEALDMYIRSYRSTSPPDPLKYNAIEALYKRINGHTMGLEQRVGANPSPTPSASTVAQRPRPSQSIPIAQPSVTPTPEPTPVAPPAPTQTPVTEPSVEVPKPTAEPSTSASPTSAVQEPTPEPETSPSPEAKPTPTPESRVEVPKIQPSTTPEPSPTPETTPMPEAIKVEPSATPETTRTPDVARVDPTPTPETTPTPEVTRVEPGPTPRPDQPEPSATSVAKENSPSTRLVDNTNGLFPPIIIQIPPSPPTRRLQAGAASATPTPTPTPESTQPAAAVDPEKKNTDDKPTVTEGRARIIQGAPTRNETIPPCTLTLDQETIALQGSGNDRAVVVRRTDDGDIEGLTGTSLSPDDIAIRREALPGVKWTALFVLRSISSKPGLFQVRFESPCGNKDVSVRVQ